LAGRTGGDFCSAELIERLEAGRWLLKINTDADTPMVLNKIGYAPVPPYIKRGSDAVMANLDKRRYQTVFARYRGAVAAPTAGLHFTEKLIGRLKDSGVIFAYVTLHVGEGTFRPVTTRTLEEHKIHSERFSVDEKNARIINTAKRSGGRIIAVGTTSVRTLETVAQAGQIRAGSGTTSLFVRHGYKFKIADAMITNFHLPKSTLLALVAAFAGLENVLGAYRHAIEKNY
ncbi:unnamed protein product, partial [marine sediment metagenome]